MIYIAHRGNIGGQNTELENSPNYVDDAIQLGYQVEVDLWIREKELFLGHDAPQYPISEEWLAGRINHLWVHCKNPEALDFLRNHTTCDIGLHYFWHQEDDYTITSNGIIWAYPGKSLHGGHNIVCVMPERANYNNEQITSCYAVCSDFVSNLKMGAELPIEDITKKR